VDKKFIYAVSTEWIQFDEGLSVSLLTALFFNYMSMTASKAAEFNDHVVILKQINELGIRAGQNCETHTGPKFETHKKQTVGT
jgi:hypothetical protein